MLPRSTATMGKTGKNLRLLALRPLHRPALRQAVLPRVQGLALNTAMGSDPILESSQCKRLGSTVASKSHNGHGRTTKEKLEPDPSNQVGPAYAYKVDHDHGAAGSHGPDAHGAFLFLSKQQRGTEQ